MRILVNKMLHPLRGHITEGIGPIEIDLLETKMRGYVAYHINDVGTVTAYTLREYDAVIVPSYVKVMSGLHAGKQGVPIQQKFDSKSMHSNVLENMYLIKNGAEEFWSPVRCCEPYKPAHGWWQKLKEKLGFTF